MVIPIILGSDKTMLSTLSGDKSAWPVYFSVGNLTKAKRRSPNTNGLILIGLLPRIPHRAKSHTQKRVYHTALREILRPLEAPEREGITIRCADGHTRLAFPRIASFLADYPEQCTITLIKYLWCPRCELPPDEFPGFNRHAARRRSDRYSDMSES